VGDHKGFTVVLRGYDPAEVDALLDRVRAALASTDPAVRASVRTELNRPAFHIRLRGYDRFQVDDYLRTAIDRLA
jgi:DivIVA domain-containing protein